MPCECNWLSCNTNRINLLNWAVILIEHTIMCNIFVYCKNILESGNCFLDNLKWISPRLNTDCKDAFNHNNIWKSADPKATISGYDPCFPRENGFALNCEWLFPVQSESVDALFVTVYRVSVPMCAFVLWVRYSLLIRRWEWNFWKVMVCLSQTHPCPVRNSLLHLSPAVNPPDLCDSEAVVK